MPRPDKDSKTQPKIPKKPALTHFLCVPLVTPASRPLLEASVQRFRNDVCRYTPLQPGHTPVGSDSKSHEEAVPPQDAPAESEGHVSLPIVAEKAVRPVGALHLTLGVMSLDAERLAEAKQLLLETDVTGLLRRGQSPPLARVGNPTEDRKTGSSNEHENEMPVADPPASLTRPISPPPISEAVKPVVVSMKSLESMHLPRKTSVLFVSPQDPTDRLYHLCNSLRTHFMKAGLLIDDKRPLKLHATIVNTIYVKGRRKPKHSNDNTEKETNIRTTGVGDKTSGNGKHADSPFKIDAIAILQKYKDYVWAENVILDRVSVCEMGAKKMFNDKGEVVSEEYREVVSLRLPGA